MNNKFLKILTGFSAMAVAGVLSFVPATRAEAATAQQGYSYSVYLWEEGVDEHIDDFAYTTSIDVDDAIHFLLSGRTLDEATANVYFYQCAQNEDFTVSMTIPYEDVQLNFLHYYDGLSYYPDGTSAPNENFVLGQNGIYSGYYVNGNIVTVYGNTSTGGCFDAVFEITFKSPKTAEDLFSEEINTTVEDIVKAAQGINHDGSENPQKVVFYNCNGAVNYRIIQALAKTQGVTLLYTFEYQGYVFTSAITSEMAAQIFIEGEDWYGPCYIAKHCPTVLVDVVK